MSPRAILVESIEKSIASQDIILEDQSIDSIPMEHLDSAKVYVTDQRTFQAARNRNGRCCVLNFAAFYAPCNGYVFGNTQEECLVRTSTLYPCISCPDAIKGYYEPHENIPSSTYNSDIIYTPDVKVFRNDDNDQEMLDEKDWYDVDVITCCAPNLNDMYIDDDELLSIQTARIDRIFQVAAHKGADVLILGAFGCGAFSNNPRIVAIAFKTAVEKYRNVFEEIVFAIPISGWDVNNRTFSEILL